jgi:hypothetical protein
MLDISQSELLVELSVEQQELLSGGVNDVYLEQQRGTNGIEAQRWRLRSLGDGTYLIENVRLSREQGVQMVLDYRP